ncbi:MAG: glycerophosphodiester phosphodiesterase [Sphingobacteriaceae bacterium]|nr:glycerophosphodiester phosphodiesterase [Sphingobacteriaceae bacterium]
MFRSAVLFLALSLFVMLAAYAQSPLDVQGHRGARGLMPENTIPAMLEAVRLGVTTLELDVVITADKQVLVSHEPWMNPEICLDPAGQELSTSKSKQVNIYSLSYDETTTYDCGSKGNSRFPEQQKIPVHKPLLADVFQAVERYCKEHKKAGVQYNIEIKSSPVGDDKQHPAPEEFADLVLAEIAKAGLLARTTIQSFDMRPLRYLNNKNSPVKLALLIESQPNYEGAIRELGFIPTIYSPYFKLVNKKLLSYAAQTGMKVIPWTVNETDDMRRMLELGVDGIITDYPNRLLELLRNNQSTVPND